ncbi:MAG: MFS transporter, partial [Lachnospiraceae bacterium]|nr:MFS transporter [Lachnospiraceae bacterium]
MTSKSNYKWVICFGLVVLMFCTIGLTFSAFSIYLPYIRDLKGFTNFETSLLLTVRTLASIVAVFFVEKYLSSVGVRKGILFSMAGVGASFLIYAFSPNFAGYLVAAGLCGWMYTMSGVAAAAILINRWFKTGRSTAMGIASAGSGVSSIIAPLIIVPIIKNASLSTAFLVEAIFILVCAAVVFILIREYPSDYVNDGTNTDGLQRAGQKSKAKIYITSRGITIILMIVMFLIGAMIYAITGFMSMVFVEHFEGEKLAFLSTVY